MRKQEGYSEIIQLWKKFDIATPSKLQAYLENIAVTMAYHSGVIENSEVTYHDTREIFLNGKVINYTGNLRTLFEIQNQKDGFKVMLRWFGERKTIGLDEIREMHYALTKNTYDERRWELGERPGQFKKNNLWGVGRHDVGAPAAAVQRALSDDLAEVYESIEEDPLIAAACFHARFEAMHPFADGNGRTGRMLMNCLLVSYDYPPIVIFEEDRRKYYDSLDAFDTEGDFSLLVSFLQEETVKTWENMAKRYKGQF